MTPADHANTIREALIRKVYRHHEADALAALDALQAQAKHGQWCRDVFENDPRSFLDGYLEMEKQVEAAEAERDRLRKTLLRTYAAVDELCARPGTCVFLRDRAALAWDDTP